MPEKSIKATKIEVLKADDEKRIVYGIVLVPDVPDSHEDIMLTDEIMKSAHNYLMFYRNAGVEHIEQANALICESYLAPLDMELNTRKITKGTWIVAMKVFSDTLWYRIKQGDYSSFSAGGFARHESEK